MPVSQTNPEDVPDAEAPPVYTSPLVIAAFVIALLAVIYYVSENVIGVEPIVGKPPQAEQSVD